LIEDKGACKRAKHQGAQDRRPWNQETCHETDPCKKLQPWKGNGGDINKDIRQYPVVIDSLSKCLRVKNLVIARINEDGSQEKT